MTTRYSTCHYAEVMHGYVQAKHLNAVREETTRCSYCGEACELVPMSLILDHDLELTLRRWKDGDCSLDDMFERVNLELHRSWDAAFKYAANVLQKDGRPKYTREPGYADWKESGHE